MSLVSKLNSDVSWMTLSYLELNEIARVSAVNKTWKELATDMVFWQNLLEGLPEGAQTKKFVASCQGFIRSEAELLQKMIAFANNFNFFTQKGSLICLFPEKPKSCYVEVQFGEAEEITSKAIYIFSKSVENWKVDATTSAIGFASGSIRIEMTIPAGTDLDDWRKPIYRALATKANTLYELAGRPVRYDVNALERQAHVFEEQVEEVDQQV